MTLEEFIAIQTQLFNAFGWFIRWGLILFASGGVIAAAVLAVLVSTRAMLDKT